MTTETRSYIFRWSSRFRRRCVCLSSLKYSLLGNFSIDDGDGNDNTTNKQFDWSSEENKRVARVART